MLNQNKFLFMAGSLLLLAVSGLSYAASAVPKDSDAQNDVLNLSQPNANAGGAVDPNNKHKKSKNFVEGEVIVKFKSRLSHSERQNLHAQNDAEVLDEIPDARLSRVKSKKGESTEALIQRYRKQKDVEYAEPNFLVEPLALPNDPNFLNLYGLNNTGQTGGTVDADIDAPEAWDIQTGSSNVIVAVIDTGTDYNHPDLAANIWTNPGEIAGNGVDDEGNGYIDDVHGWDFRNNDNDPMDDVGHGTHVSGTIAAVGNNNLGVVGVAWRAQIMPLKFLSADGGSTWNAILAIRYAAQKGAKILSNSWGCVAGTPQDCFSQALEDTLYEIAPSGTLFVAAAGNDSNNNEFSIRGPCSSSAPNAICVAATDHKDQLADFSNYGSARVDIAAPGVNIYSTVPTIACSYCNASGYLSMSGTSMATPHVSGAAALVLSQFPQSGAAQLKQLLMSSGDLIPGLSGKVLSGGRLNVFNALRANFVISPSSDEVKANVGESTDFNLTLSLSSFNGLSGSVNLNVNSPNPEISVSPATATLTPVNGSAVMNLAIHVNSAITKGVYVLPVVASDSLGETRTTSIVVRVLEPDFDVTVSSGSRDLVPGDGANYAVTLVSKDGYAKPVTLSYSASNGSITGGFSQSTVLPSSTGSAIETTVSTLFISTTAGLPPGSHTLEIQASDGIKTVSKTVTINAVSQIRTPNQVWASRASGWLGQDEAGSHLAQGPGGSVYIAGSACVSSTYGFCDNTWNMLLVKYDADGTVSWRAEYDYQSEHDYLRGISVDINGDVYLVGGNSAAKIVKYSGATGALLWAKYETTPFSPEGIATDVVGNVYVMGMKNGFPRLYVVNKYNPAGTLLWSASYPVGILGYPYSLKLDGTGNAYVAGYYNNSGGFPSSDFMLVKFDPSGQVLWAKRYDGGGADSPYYTFDSLNPVVDVDTAGNIYVAGQSSNGSSADFLTLKYSPDGIVLWERRFDSGSTDGVADIKLDGAGNVIVTGYSCQSHASCSSNYLTLKYNSQGDLLWSNRYDHQLGNDITTALDIDAAGNVYVTGRSLEGGYYDYATVKYSPDGQLQWVGRYNATTSDQAEDVLVDGGGNVFVSGVSRNASADQDFDFVVVKYAGPPVDVDLVMTEVSTTATNVSPGSSFTISNTEMNQGASMTMVGNTVKFYLSVDNDFTTASDNILLTGIRTVPTLAAGASSNAITTVTVPMSAEQRTYYIIAVADATNALIETNTAGNPELNNWRAGGTIYVMSTVDLVMTAVSTTATSVAPGKTLSLSNTVNNQGGTSVGSSVTSFHLSSDAVYGGLDDIAFTATRSVASLAAGASSTAATTLTVPATTPLASYYLCAMTDSGLFITEGDESNNTRCTASPIQITRPDLIMTSVMPGILSGLTLPVTDVVQNIGAVPGTGSFTIAFRLSVNTSYGDADDVVIATTRSVASLAAGTINTATTSLTIPATVSGGNYYLCAKADSGNTNVELDENNNTRCSSTQVTIPPPDLIVSTLTTTSTVAGPGATFSLTNAARNIGGSTAGSFAIAFHLSADAVYGGTDDIVFTATRTVASLGVGASSSLATTLTVPITTPVGFYYLCALADSNNTVVEGNESNNASCTATQIRIANPDLMVTALSMIAGTANGGGTLVASHTVTNGGGGPAGASTTAFRLSLDTVFGNTDDVIIATTQAVGILAPGQSLTYTTNLLIPVTVKAGAYYLCARADNLLKVAEANETNNAACTGNTVFIPPPDLIVSALSSTATSANAGATVSQSNSVKNQGSSAAGSSIVAFRLSTNTVYGDADDIISTTTRTIASLSTGATSTATTSVLIPATTPAGTYYLCAMADKASTVLELDEANNTACTTTTITVPPPDLVMSALSTTATAVSAGASFALSNTTKNQGGSTATTFAVGFVLSLNNVIGDGDDITLTPQRLVTSLNAGISSAASTSVTVPLATPSGSYYIGAIADVNGTVMEGSEGNNTRVTAGTVLVP